MVEKWEVIAYESRRGDKPVEDFIYSLPRKVISKVTHDIDLLSICGRLEVRFFHVFRRTKIYLLHTFLKKYQKTPKKELEAAISRVSECV